MVAVLAAIKGKEREGGGLPQSEAEAAAEAAAGREVAGFKGKDGGAGTPIPPCSRS